MQEMTFGDATDFSVAFLFKTGAFDSYEIRSRYLDNLYAVKPEEAIAFTVAYTEKNKAPAAFVKSHVADEILPEVAAHNIKVIYCADAPYFKALTKVTNTKHMWGYALPCAVKGYEDIQVVLGFNYQQLVYDPTLSPRLDITLEALDSVVNGSYVPPGSKLTENCRHLLSFDDIKMGLEALHSYPVLAADIEAFSLKVTHAGLGTISFAPNTNQAVAFPIEYQPRCGIEVERHKAAKIWDNCYGYQRENKPVATLLREFFEAYQGKLIWHNATYDLRCLIWSLFMDHPLDYKGMLHGLKVMTRDFEDTKIIAYLATNSTAKPELGLKSLAQNFAGNYAQDVKDIRRLEVGKLLDYNCVDTMSTMFVYEEYLPQLKAADQEDLYRGLMKDSLVTIIQTELVGMPMDAGKVKVARQELELKLAKWRKQLYQNPIVKRFNTTIQIQEMEKANAKLKTKQHPVEAFGHIVFNPASSPQAQQLLYNVLKLPVLDYTDSKQPAIGRKTLKKLMNHTKDPEILDLLEAMIGIGKVAKILSAFIPAFEAAYPKADGCVYLHGNFNLGGTVSGRLSSNDPNLQQIPSGSEDAKLIKDAFRAPKGWVFCGADFNSLEDYISALTTKDPNKLKVYSGLKQYDITINGKTHRIKEGDVVSYNGTKLTGEMLYEKLQNSQP